MRLYKKPVITGRILAVLGLAAMLNPAYLPGMIPDYSGMDYGYAIAVFGVMFLITGVVILAVYGAMEKQYQSGMQGNALLNYMISDSMREKAVDKEIGMIRGNNRAALLLILLFCGIFAVLLSILFQDALFFLICAGLAAFMTISFFIITAYRVRKAVKSGNQILVTEKGAFAFGQFHSWSIAGSWLDTARYDEPAKTLWICYSAVSRTGPVSCTVRIPVPEEQEEPARRTVSILTSIAAHK